MRLPDHVEALLQRPNICVLATTGPGEWPHAIPMWYLYRDGDIIITTSRRSQKCKNVERTGKAVVVVDTREPPYHAVSVRGDARIGAGLSREEEYRLALSYLGEERIGKFMEHYDSGAGDDATIVVTPRKLIEYRSG